MSESKGKSLHKVEHILRRFGPKQEEGTGHGKPCPACEINFKPGDFTTLIPLGPGDDLEAREKAVAGRPYNAIAIEVHWSCATGRPDVEAGIAFKADF
jgi:hypothetical protein